MMILENLSLEGNLVKLVPLEKEHKNDLLLAASDGELWNLFFTSVPSAETIDAYIDSVLEQKQQNSYPFVVVHKPTNKIIGSTRYYNIDPKCKKLYIGYTWYAKSYQRTGVNAECKYLLLKYAFENLSYHTVRLETHHLNHKSKEAILRLGAKQDGILRNDKIDSTGNLRDTILFSIVQQEWVGVKELLEYKTTLK